MSVATSRLASIPSADGLFKLSQNEFSEIAAIVQRECGIHLTQAKFGLIVTRLQKRLLALGLDSFREYIGYLKSNTGKVEIEEMISNITTNVTSFNREAHHFNHFRENVLPGLVDVASSGHSVRLWSAGCSDGREPYTLACAIFDAFPEVRRYDFKILATDIDKYSLAKARSGEYTKEMVATLPPGSSGRWFVESGDSLGVKQEVKSIIQFNLLNLMTSWPMKKKFDVIFCRNVMIYFSSEDQARLLSKFSENLNESGHLYLGHSERVEGKATSIFKQVGVTTYLHQPKGIQV